MLEPSCGMVEGGRPPLADGCGMGEGECAGDGTGIGDAVVCWSVLLAGSGESWKPNWGMAPLGPPTGPPLVPVKLTEPLRSWAAMLPLTDEEPRATAGTAGGI